MCLINDCFIVEESANVHLRVSQPIESISTIRTDSHTLHFNENNVHRRDSKNPAANDSVVYSFNNIFHALTPQSEIFSHTLSHYVHRCVAGHDLTVMTYGDKGSGKSFTLFGPDLPLAMNESDFGIVYRFIRALIHQSSSKSLSNSSYVGLVEDKVVNLEFFISHIIVEDDDEIIDLFEDEENGVSFSNSDSSTSTFPPQSHVRDNLGCIWIPCRSSFSQIVQHIQTSLSIFKSYKEDSRGHSSSNSVSIFSILMRRVVHIKKDDGEEKYMVRRYSSCVRFFDLPPSTNLCVAPGPPNTSSIHPPSESFRINRSLLALHNNISSVGDLRRHCSSNSSSQIDSKIFKLLNPAINGLSNFCLFCCVAVKPLNDINTIGPNDEIITDTLDFGRRVSNIKSKPIQWKEDDVDWKNECDWTNSDKEEIKTVDETSLDQSWNVSTLSTSRSLNLSDLSRSSEQQCNEHQIPPPPEGVDPVLYNLFFHQILNSQLNSNALSDKEKDPVPKLVTNYSNTESQDSIEQKSLERSVNEVKNDNTATTSLMTTDEDEDEIDIDTFHIEDVSVCIQKQIDNFLIEHEEMLTKICDNVQNQKCRLISNDYKGTKISSERDGGDDWKKQIRTDCELLREEKGRMYVERMQLEKEHDQLKKKLLKQGNGENNKSAKNEDTSVQYVNNEMRRTQIDELFHTIDLSIEHKNVKLTKNRQDSLLEEISDDSNVSEHLIGVLSRMENDECRCLIHKLVTRLIDLRMEKCKQDIDLQVGSYKLRDVERSLRSLNHKYVSLKHKYISSQESVEKRCRLKLLSTEKQVERMTYEVERLKTEKEELQTQNHSLKTFYRQHRNNKT